jgi:FKBP-type peptidyl-prolyl cis-trans isomerase SlpA
MKKVQIGDTVIVNYTGKLEDGTIFDSSLNEGREPLKSTLGQNQLIPGFEQGLLDMSIGDKKTIEIEPENAYGDIKPQMVSEVPLSQVPEGVKAGDMLQGQNQFGPVNVVVTEVKESTAVLDMNHPLAGKKLIFDLEVVSVN